MEGINEFAKVCLCGLNFSTLKREKKEKFIICSNEGPNPTLKGR